MIGRAVKDKQRRARFATAEAQGGWLVVVMGGALSTDYPWCGGAPCRLGSIPLHGHRAGGRRTQPGEKIGRPLAASGQRTMTQGCWRACLISSGEQAAGGQDETASRRANHSVARSALRCRHGRRDRRLAGFEGGGGGRVRLTRTRAVVMWEQ